MKRVGYSKKASHTESKLAKGRARVFNNKKVLRDILKSRPDIDWANAPANAFVSERLEHPEFTGTALKLLHHAFGLKNSPHSRSRTMEDFRMLLWFAMEDEMIEADNKRLGDSGVGTVMERSTLSPERLMELGELINDERKPRKRRKKLQAKKAPTKEVEAEEPIPKEVLRDILKSRKDIDWASSNVSRLLGTRFEHPEFSGNLVSLFHRTFGLARKPNTKTIPARDARMLLWFAMEDEMIEGDERRLERSEIAERAGKISRMLPDQYIEEKEKDPDAEKFVPMHDKKRIAKRALGIKKQFEEASSKQEIKESSWKYDLRLFFLALDLSACSERAGVSLGIGEAIWELKRVIRSQEEETK